MLSTPQSPQNSPARDTITPSNHEKKQRSLIQHNNPRDGFEQETIGDISSFKVDERQTLKSATTTSRTDTKVNDGEVATTRSKRLKPATTTSIAASVDFAEKSEPNMKIKDKVTQQNNDTNNLKNKNPTATTKVAKNDTLLLDDSILDSYTPMKKRVADIKQLQQQQPDKVSFQVSSLSTESPSSSQAIASEILEPLTLEEMILQQEMDSTMRKLREVRTSADIVLSDPVYKQLKEKKLRWPYRRIHNTTGLSQDTINELKPYLNGVTVKPDVQLYARIEGRISDKWSLYDLRNHKIASFNDSPDRKTVDKFLEKHIKPGVLEEKLKTKKEVTPLEKLKLAMIVAAQMSKNAPKSLDTLRSSGELGQIPIDGLETATVRGYAAHEQRAVPSAEQLRYDNEPIPVQFVAGMTIYVKGPNVNKQVKITKISFNDRLKEYELTFSDDFVLIDEIGVSAGENKLFFPFGKLKAVSTFIEGEDGISLSSWVTKRAEEGLKILQGVYDKDLEEK
jgi:hypothetical protein